MKIDWIRGKVNVRMIIKEKVHRTLLTTGLQAFCIYASVMGEKCPDLCSGLFQHIEIILEAYKNFPGFSWFIYDKAFSPEIIWPMAQSVVTSEAIG